MPQMGYDMQEGTVVRWLKAEGEDVKVGEPVAEIETDKAVVEFESTTSGVLRKVLVTEGTTLPVGQTIAIVGSADEELPDVVADAPPVPEEPPEAEAAPEAPPPPPPAAVEQPATSGQEVKASPVARRLADERGVDLAQVNGTGPGGRITKSDVLAAEPSEAVAPAAPAPVAPTAAPAPVAAAADGQSVPLTRMRQQIARVTVRSKQEIPHFYVSADVDMGPAMALREQLNSMLGQQGMKVSVNDMIIKACVGALKVYPKFNASFAEDSIQMNGSINIGVAIAQEAGLIVPAILDAGSKSLVEISVASKDLIARSKSGTLHPQEYTGGTFSISNMGMFDITSFVAIIHPPNAAMLAVGKVTKTPVVRDDELAIAEVMSSTLSVDHRIADGAEGATFIGEIKRLLENPASLLV